MEETTRVRTMIAISVLVLIGSGLMIVLFEGFNLWTTTMFLALVALATVALYVVTRAMKDLRSGIPLQDERSKALAGRAAHISFYLSMYLALALAFVFIVLGDSRAEVSNAELLFVVVAMMGSIHLAVSGYFNRKGTKAVR